MRYTILETILSHLPGTIVESASLDQWAISIEFDTTELFVEAEWFLLDEK